MSFKLIFKCSTLFLFLLLATVCSAQVDTLKSPTMRIVLKDGSILIGRIESSENKLLNFITAAQIKIKIPQSEIEEINRIDEFASGVANVKEDSLKQSDRNLSRMLFFPTARPIGIYQSYAHANIFQFPGFYFGIGNFLSVGVSSQLYSLLSEPIFLLNGKATFLNSEWLSLACGIIYLTSTDVFVNGEGAAFVHGLSTIGNKDYSVTIGLGSRLGSFHWSDDAMLIIGGEFKLNNNLKFITENWIVNDEDFKFHFFGIRILGEQWSADVAALYNNKNRYIRYIYPWLSVTYNFSLK